MDTLTALGYIAAAVNIAGIIVGLSHWRLYTRAEKTRLSRLMAAVFLSVILMSLSNLVYNTNIVFNGGDLSQFRELFKGVQIASSAFLLVTLVLLSKHYKER